MLFLCFCRSPIAIDIIVIFSNYSDFRLELYQNIMYSSTVSLLRVKINWVVFLTFYNYLVFYSYEIVIALNRFFNFDIIDIMWCIADKKTKLHNIYNNCVACNLLVWNVTRLIFCWNWTNVFNYSFTILFKLN